MTLSSLKPPPKQTVSEWADTHRVLSSETSASPGRWITHSFQKPIMDAFNDPLVETVVFQAGSQLGKTEILLNVLAYHIALDPSPIMIIQPTLSMAVIAKTYLPTDEIRLKTLEQEIVAILFMPKALMGEVWI